LFRPSRLIRQVTGLRPGTPTIGVWTSPHYNATYDLSAGSRGTVFVRWVFPFTPHHEPRASRRAGPPATFPGVYTPGYSCWTPSASVGPGGCYPWSFIFAAFGVRGSRRLPPLVIHIRRLRRPSVPEVATLGHSYSPPSASVGPGGCYPWSFIFAAFGVRRSRRLLPLVIHVRRLRRPCLIRFPAPDPRRGSMSMAVGASDPFADT